MGSATKRTSADCLGGARIRRSNELALLKLGAPSLLYRRNERSSQFLWIFNDRFRWEHIQLSAGADAGLFCSVITEMPTNNLSVVFRRI
jgi:hypothetical protein